MISEQTLAAKLKDRDRIAMKSLYDLYSGFLTAVCSRYILDSEDVRDVLQESFIKIFSGIDKFEFRGPGSLKAWISRIVVNESLKFLKKTSKEDFILSGEYEGPADGIADDITDEDLDVEEVPMEVIQEMIRKLPTGYRTIFNLYVFEDKSHKEIAGILGIKENSSASQLHRAKAMLAAQINEYKQNKI